jgi:hypothetical protein
MSMNSPLDAIHVPEFYDTEAAERYLLTFKIDISGPHGIWELVSKGVEYSNISPASFQSEISVALYNVTFYINTSSVTTDDDGNP